ncbi:hypothetical protein EC528_08205, partial [Helicobacter pylori]|uniref:hypothetical protein n=1 Tax=Helicobacter pylori TaxID=210 RepID=UPI0010064E9E
MSCNNVLKFRFHNNFLLLPLSFLSAVEFNYFICILYHLKNKGNEKVELGVKYHRGVVDKKYLNALYHSRMISLRDKLEKHGMIGNAKDCLFSGLDLLIDNGKVKSIVAKISDDKSYMFNN